MSNALFLHASGGRKSALARVYLREGGGSFVVNNKDYKLYFPLSSVNAKILKPFSVLGLVPEKFDIKVNVTGGGFNAQAEAIRLAIAKILVSVNEEHKSLLRKEGLLTRDSRVVESKKPGRKKARRSYQFSKR